MPLASDRLAVLHPRSGFLSVIVICLVGLAHAPPGAAQVPDGCSTLYVVVEESPQHPGLEELRSRIRYPAQARAPRVTRGVHPDLDAEAVRVVRETSFTPGRQRGEPVCVQMSLPVTFRLDGAAAPPRPAAPVVEPVQSAASTVQSATASASDAVSEQAAQVDRTTQALTQQTTAAAGSVEASANAISESVDSTKAAVATSAATTKESLGGAKESLTGTFRSLFGRGQEAGAGASVPTADGAGAGDGDGSVPDVGATLAARIDNIALRAEASAEAAVVGQVTTEEALIYLGEASNGFLLVQLSAGSCSCPPVAGGSTACWWWSGDEFVPRHPGPALRAWGVDLPAARAPSRDARSRKWGLCGEDTLWTTSPTRSSTRTMTATFSSIPRGWVAALPILFVVLLGLGAPAAAQDLNVYMTASSEVVGPGDRTTYTLMVTNTGLVDLNDVSVNVQLPDHIASFPEKRSEGFDCSGSINPNVCIATGAATWTVGTLSPGQARIVFYQVRITNSAPPGSITTSLTASSSGIADIERELNVEIEPAPGVRLHIAPESGPVDPGASQTYVLTYGNIGTENLSNASLTMSLPDGTTFGSASDGGAVSGNVVTWSLDPLGIGGSGQVRITIGVDPSLPDGSVLATTAECNPSTGAPPARSSVATAVRSLEPLQIEYAVSQTVLSEGESIDVTLAVTNSSAFEMVNTLARLQRPSRASTRFLRG